MPRASGPLGPRTRASRCAAIPAAGDPGVWRATSCGHSDFTQRFHSFGRDCAEALHYLLDADELSGLEKERPFGRTRRHVLRWPETNAVASVTVVCVMPPSAAATIGHRSLSARLHRRVLAGPPLAG